MKIQASVNICSEKQPSVHWQAQGVTDADEGINKKSISFVQTQITQQYRIQRSPWLEGDKRIGLVSLLFYMKIVPDE